MVSTIQENDNGTVSFLTEETTTRGRKFVITTTPTGMYRIEVVGGGALPKITEDVFTNLPAAKEALKRYQNENEALINKRRIHLAAIERRKAEHDQSESE